VSAVPIRITGRRFFPGCTEGLDEKTVLVDLEVSGDPGFDADADARFRAGAAALCPEEPLFGVADGDWPEAFLQPRAVPDRTGLARLASWVVALAVAIQRWGHDPVWRGRVLLCEQHRVRLALGWYREPFCTAALDLAVRLAEQWLQPQPPTVRPLHDCFDGRWATIQAGGLPPYTLRFVRAAAERGMPFDVMPAYVQIGWGAQAERFDMAYTGHTSWLSSALVKNKWKAHRTLAAALIPVPAARAVTTVEAAERAGVELGWPLVVKPLGRKLGAGVVLGIGDRDALRRACEKAFTLSPTGVLVEQHVPGDDHRLLVVRNRMLMAVRRVPAGVCGDGERTVRDLMDRVNADPRRGTHRYSLLKRLVLDDTATACLAAQGLHADAVPAAGRFVAVRPIADITTGGTTEDVTGIVHPDNAALARRAARVVGLDVAGVDFLTTDISRSWREIGGAIREINSQPGFSPHWLAAPHRDLEGEVLDILFAGRSGRIPTAAITGTNGKTTTAAMLHRILRATGRRTGMSTTAAVVIGDDVISTENLSGQPGARIILNDPTVQAAVFEMPRKGLIRFGHPCDRYDVAALLNVRDDHIGVDGVESLQQMAELKAEVLQRARCAVVINADDPLCLAMLSRAGAERHILVAQEATNAAVAEHLRAGGEAVFVDIQKGARWMVLAAGPVRTPLMPLAEIPATMAGLLRVNGSNAMFAAALAWALGVDLEVVRTALGSFGNALADNPGRYNFIDGLPFGVLLDYAHNPDGVDELCRVVRGLPLAAGGRRMLCSVQIGNRHPGHLEAAAPHLAGCFDEFVIGCHPDEVSGYRGDDPVQTMLAGATRALVNHGVPAERVHTVADPTEAIRTAVQAARAGDLLVVLAEPGEALPVIDAYLSGSETTPPRR
jgi:cyanophycin synthetase